MRAMFGLTFLTLLFSVVTGAQESSFTFHNHSDSQPKKKRSWIISGESGFSNLFESYNKVELIDGTNSYVKASYLSRINNRFALQLGTTGAVQNNEPYGGVFSLNTGLRYQKSLRTSLEINNEFTFSDHKRFGNFSGGINYVFGETDKLATFYTQAHYYYSLESSSRYKVSSGLAGFMGVKGVLEKHTWEGETKLELIADRNSIVKGERILVNGEIFLGLRLNRLRIGPRLGYWQKVSGNFEHEHAVNYGLALVFK